MSCNTFPISALTIWSVHPERHQWACLVLLMGGVALIQVPAQDPATQAAGAEQAPGPGVNKQKLVGLAAVFAACLSSGQYIFFQKQYIDIFCHLFGNYDLGFAGVFYEKLLKKGAQPSVVIRKICLTFIFCPLKSMST